MCLNTIAHSCLNSYTLELGNNVHIVVFEGMTKAQCSVKTIMVLCMWYLDYCNCKVLTVERITVITTLLFHI